MFTCISCRVAFEAAAEQRSHFSTDWHRYNMKRRVANLPPVAAESFNEKVIERREQNAVRTDPRSLSCDCCNKSFSSENAFRSHIQSKKHRDRETSQSLGGAHLTSRSTTVIHEGEPTPDSTSTSRTQLAIGPLADQAASDDGDGGTSDDDPDEDEGDFAAKIAKARRRIQPTDCLFCAVISTSVAANVEHMAKSHSFFIPDREILIDINGLLSYLGEKVAIGNLCLFCPNGGREFGSLEAVRRHMNDKAHCKIAYETNEDRAELADFYDFESGSDISDAEWEDVDDETSQDEETIIKVNKRHTQRNMSLAPDGLSLMLPSGRTLGHRSLRVYYAQRLRPFDDRSASDSIAAKVANVRQRLADPSQALVPVAGGHGAFGRGQELVKARNAGEAKWVRRQGRSFNDQRIKEQFKTKVGFIHNSQKHFRDPLLQ